MKLDTIVKLGDFAFSGLEVPEQIPYGGAQAMTVHKLVGGKRIVDAMGEDNAPLQWTGLFTGPTAHLRARYLDTLRVKGGELKLTWAEHSYRVVIRAFNAQYQRFYQIPYSITLEVVADETKEMNWVFDPPVDQAIADDMLLAGSLGVGIGDSVLSGLLKTLDTAIANVSSFAKAGTSVVNSVLRPLAAVQARVKLLSASVGNVIGGLGTFGGVLPGNKVTQGASKLLSALSAVQQAGSLWRLANVLGRMNGNLGTIGSGTSQTFAGENMYQIAQQMYGNATDWTTIARANGKSDPMVYGMEALAVPARADDQGGILST